MTRRPIRDSAAAIARGRWRGASLVLTRPAGTAAALARRIRRDGGHAVCLPGVSLRAVDDVAATRRRLRAARGADDWVFTSPAAVRFAARLLPRLPIARHARVFAIGAATATALARRHVVATVPPARTDSEALLELPALARVRGRRIVVVGTVGGRDLIAATLRRRGAVVATIAVYRSVPARLTRRHFGALATAPKPRITLLSSLAALAALAAALPAPLLAGLRDGVLVVSSPRLAAAAREHGFGTIVPARSALADDLLAAAEAALPHRRTPPASRRRARAP
jgi:uroporphyrinogen-III synthase